MPNAVIPANDPRAFGTVLLATQRTAIDRARLVAEFMAVMQVPRGSTRQAYRDAMIDARSEFDRKLAGRDGVLDVSDDLKTALGSMSVLGSVLDTVAALTPGVTLVKQLIDPAAALKSISTAGTVILSSPFVADYVSDSRARNGAAYAAQVTDAFAPAVGDMTALVMQEAESYPELAKAVHDVHPLEVPTERDTITAGSCVQDHPELFPVNITVRVDNSVVIKDVEQARQDILTQIGIVGADTKTALTQVQVKLDAINTSNTQIAGGVQGILVFLQKKEQAEQEHAKQEKLRQEAEAAVQGLWDTAGATLAAASAVASLLGDPKLARDITRFGNAAITVTKAVIGFVNATTAISAGLTAVTALGAAAATGNLIAAAGALLQLVTAADEPTPEQMILDGIGQIQSQLSEMQDQISEGFDRLDEHLSQIYTSVMKALSELTATANMTLAEAQKISRQLAAQSMLIEQMLAETGEWFKAAERAALSQDIRTALRWRDNNQEPLPAADFAIFAGHFYNWAVETSFDEINQPVQGRPTDLASAARELDGNLIDNVSYLNHLLAGSSKSSFGDQVQIPNVQMWSLAALAFAQLRAEWPHLARRDDPRLLQIQGVGTAFRDNLRALAADRTLFPAVIADYDKACDALVASMSDFRGRFESEHVLKILGYTIGDPQLTSTVNLFTDAASQITFTLEEGISTVRGLNGGANLSPVPKALLDAVPSNCWLADYLHPTARKVNFAWSADKHEETTEHRNPKTGELETVTIWVMTVDVEARFDQALIVSFTWSTPCSDSTNPVAQTPGAWSTIVQELDDRHSKQGDSSVFNSADRSSEEVLQELREALAAAVADEMRSPNGDLYLCARQVDGARSVIENLVRLLLPIPRHGDDLLRAILEGMQTGKGGLRLPDASDFGTQFPTHLGLDDGHAEPRPVIELAAWSRSLTQTSLKALGERLTQWQDAIEHHEFSNPQPEIDDTLARLITADVALGYSLTVRDLFANSTAAIGELEKTVHLAEAGVWAPSLTDSLLLVRHAAHEKRIPPDPAELRHRIGSKQTGKWNAHDQTALVHCVKLIQQNIGVLPDGDWGPRTDARYGALLEVATFATAP